MENGRFDKGQDPERKSDQKRLKFQWPFFFGHCPSLTAYLNSKKGRTWRLPKHANALLRGIAQVLFANNPCTGLLFLMGIFWQSWRLGGIVIASTNIAILTAHITKQNADAISSGVISFNAVLLSSVTVSLWKPLYEQEVDVKIYAFILIGSFFSILMFDGLSNLFSSFRPPIPVLSLPFHVLIITLFACFKPEVEIATGEIETLPSGHGQLHNGSLVASDDLPFSDSIMTNLANETNADLYSWDTVQNVLWSIPLYSCQVFGFPDIFVGILMYAGMLLYSPLITLMCVYGGLVSTVVGLFLTPFPNAQVFIGVYGFNGFLVGGASTLFFVFNRYAFLNLTANAVFTAVLQASITDLFAKLQLPVFGIPFLISTAIFISVTGDRAGGTVPKYFVRLEEITFPEMDRKKYYANDTVAFNGHERDEEGAAGRSLMDVTQ